MSRALLSRRRISRAATLVVATVVVAYGWVASHTVRDADAAEGRGSFGYLQAEDADAQHGTRTEPTRDTGGGEDVTGIGDGDGIRFAGIVFPADAPARLFHARIASAASVAGTIEIRIDSATGPAIAALTSPRTGGWQSWDEATAPMARTVTGRHDLYLTFTSPAHADFANLNWIRFT
ncbi:MAG: lamA1 [Actinomycetia bacterium]|jgi:hypothetical protein|nr:lamA1 [Actinomycetes bacterium]MDQ1651488.1 hypothetical protein [Cryptosporangiaceae bacterium]